ncbi:MAG TPA: hypothetical protein VFR23_24750 [Jiangellaceae bacterium]|nr:hypothetical protein [Jiangellaceae bacterium]
MAFTVRNVPDAMVFALVAAWNRRQEDAVASNFHADVTQITGGDYRAPTVTDDTFTNAHAVPTDAATCVTAVNAFKRVINRHFADTRAHNSAVTAAMGEADATDLTTAIAVGNQMKADYNAHLSESSVHFNNDGTNTIAAADGTNLTTLVTLLTELRTDATAHIINATPGEMINLVDA